MQRKCGTCKYFEEGGIASSGWCRHPDRQELEHMVLVRKTELACRQGWDHDLWEPRERAGARAGAKQGDGSKRQRPPSRDAMAGSGVATQPDHELEADRVVDMGIGADQPERHVSATQRQHADSPLTVRQTEPPTTGTETDYRSLWSSRPTTSNQGEDQLQEETISRRFGTRREEWDEPASPPAPPAKPSVFPIPIDVDVSPKEGADFRSRSPKETHLNGHQAPEPTFRNVSHQQEEHEQSSDSVPSVAPHEERPPAFRSGATEQFDAAPVHQPEPSQHNVEKQPEPVASEESLAVEMEDLDDRQAINLPMLKNEKASCRNCRDFLPAKDGFGWCDNPFAFEQRKKVSGDEVACQSSFGSWWSPSDDWWMERADIAHHSAPTPLFDNLIRQLRTRYFGVEGSTEGQERS